jgi:hypothetical protein
MDGRWVGENIVRAAVHTDPHASAPHFLEVIQEHIVLECAIVFSHFTGCDHSLYIQSEWLAADRVLDKPRYFNLADTGAFLRLR